METAGSLGLPVGCHFEPSHKEILLHFLYNKMHGLPLSCNAVTECDLYGNKETWRQLFDRTSERCLYFFIVLKKKTEKGSRVERTSSGGCVTWRSQSDKPIKVKLDPQAATETHIGFKRKFAYVPKEGSTSMAKGEWVMHEFRFDERFLDKNNKANYVLCRVINKQKLQRRRQPRLIRGNVNQEIKSNIVSEVLYHEEQNDDAEELDVGSEILNLLGQD